MGWVCRLWSCGFPRADIHLLVGEDGPDVMAGSLVGGLATLELVPATFGRILVQGSLDAGPSGPRSSA